MNAICFDIEAADNEEMLELSVFDYSSGEEIFHSYFKPRHISRWPNSQAVHHITPRMVADKPFFSEKQIIVQRLIDNADLLIGFAIDNDLKYLRKAGIDIPDDKRIAESKQWYWICRGKADGLPLDAVPRLTVCAQNMDIEFPEEDAHSASADTRNTLRLFRALVEEYSDSRNLPSALDEALIDSLDAEYAEARALFDRENARGFISLQPKPGGYYLKNSHLRPEKADLIIEVESRFKAEHEIRSMFARREDREHSGFYHLKPADIKAFEKYTNTFDSLAEKLYRSMYAKGRAARNRLNFRIG